MRASRQVKIIKGGMSLSEAEYFSFVKSRNNEKWYVAIGCPKLRVNSDFDLFGLQESFSLNGDDKNRILNIFEKLNENDLHQIRIISAKQCKGKY